MTAGEKKSVSNGTKGEKYEDESVFAKDDSEKWEKQRIIKALKNNGLSRTKAAAELGISRSTLWNKMKYFKIDM